MMIAETAGGASGTRSPSGVGGRAIWQWTHPMGSLAREGQRAGEHLVEDDAHRIEVAARIDRAVHPAGLFGRHVGERAGGELGLVGRRAFSRQAGGAAEAGQVDGEVSAPLGRLVHQDIGRPDVLVDEPPLMDLADRFHELDGEAQEPPRLHRAAQQLRKRDAAGILQHQHGAPALAQQLHGPGRPRGLQFVLQTHIRGRGGRAWPAPAGRRPEPPRGRPHPRPRFGRDRRGGLRPPAHVPTV